MSQVRESMMPGLAAVGLVGASQNRRVKISSVGANGAANTYDLCGSTDTSIGTCETKVNAAADHINVWLSNDNKTKIMVASKAIAANVPVYAAASGKISDSGTVLVGTSNEAATADGDFIEVIPCEQTGVVSWPTVSTMNVISASGAITITATAKYVITKAGVAAMTLAAPVAGTGDGVVIELISSTDFAHTLTATGGLFQSASGLVTAVTFAAKAGASVKVVSYNGFWIILDGIGLKLPELVTVISGDAAISPHVSGKYLLTKGSAAAITIAAPTATVDDGVKIEIYSASAFAHVITATGLIQDGSTTTDVCTFAAHAGASVTFMAYNGKLLTQAQIQSTFT